jgi:hypothetical protein
VAIKFMKVELLWFPVTEALPSFGKPVLASDGKSVSISQIVRLSPTGEPNWQSDVKVIHWALLPVVPICTGVEEEQNPSGPSVW